MTGADGIGLFRTEFQFLVSATLPGRERQQRLYTKVLQAAGNKPVVFRTVDIGGDKALPYLSDDADEKAENPAMGWRALRLSLDRSALMRAQSRALIEASAGKVLRVMFPMISEPWEYEQARASVRGAGRMGAQSQAARSQGNPVRRDARGAEPCRDARPAAATSRFPVDRNQRPRRSSCSPPTAPTRASRSATTGSAQRSCASSSASSMPRAPRMCPVRICGEMAGRPLEAMALVGIGAENFSITPAGVGPVKAMVRSLDAGAVRGRLDQLLARPPKRHAQGLDRLGAKAFRDNWLTPVAAALKQGAASGVIESEAMDEDLVEDGRPDGRRAAARRARGEGPQPRRHRRPDSNPAAPPRKHREWPIGTRFRRRPTLSDSPRATPSAVGLDRTEIGDQLRAEMGGQRFSANTAEVFEAADPARTMPKWLVLAAVGAVIVLVVVMSWLNSRSLDQPEEASTNASAPRQRPLRRTNPQVATAAPAQAAQGHGRPHRNRRRMAPGQRQRRRVPLLRECSSPGRPMRSRRPRPLRCSRPASPRRSGSTSATRLLRRSARRRPR